MFAAPPPPAPQPAVVRQGMLGTELSAWKAERPEHAAAVCAATADLVALFAWLAA